MMLANYLVALMVGLIVLISTTKAAEQAVPHLEEQPKLCTMDIPTHLRLHDDEKPSLWDRPVNGIIAAILFARQASVCGTSTTASEAARRTESAHIPLTIDGPVADTIPIDDAFATCNILTIDGPVSNIIPVDGAAALVSGPMKFNSPPKIDGTILDTTRAREAISFGPIKTDIPLTIDGPVLDTTPSDEAATFSFCPPVLLTIDGPVLDTTFFEGAANFGFEPVGLTIPLTIDGPPPATPPTKHAASLPSSSLIFDIPLTIGGPAFRDHLIDMEASSKSSLEESRVIQISDRSVPNRKKNGKEAALNRPLYFTVPLTISAPIPKKTFVNIGDPAETPPQIPSDSSNFTDFVVEGILGIGETTSCNTTGPEHPVSMILSRADPMGESFLARSDYSESRQAASFRHATTSGVIPRGRSPDAISDNFTLWGMIFWYYGIGLIMYFLGHIFPRSSFGKSKSRCFTIVDVKVDDGLNWLLAPRRSSGGDSALKANSFSTRALAVSSYAITFAMVALRVGSYFPQVPASSFFAVKFAMAFLRHYHARGSESGYTKELSRFVQRGTLGKQNQTRKSVRRREMIKSKQTSTNVVDHSGGLVALPHLRGLVFLSGIQRHGVLQSPLVPDMSIQRVCQTSNQCRTLVVYHQPYRTVLGRHSFHSRNSRQLLLLGEASTQADGQDRTMVASTKTPVNASVQMRTRVGKAMSQQYLVQKTDPTILVITLRNALQVPQYYKGAISLANGYLGVDSRNERMIKERDDTRKNPELENQSTKFHDAVVDIYEKALADERAGFEKEAMQMQVGFNAKISAEREKTRKAESKLSSISTERNTLEEKAQDWELRATKSQNQLQKVLLDHKAAQKATELKLEELKAKAESLENDKKRSEEDHTRQITKKQKELEKVQKDKSSLAEVNVLLQERLARKTKSENKKQKDLEAAQSSKNEIAIAYRKLCEELNTKVAAGAEKDREITDLETLLNSAKSALARKSAEKVKSDAANEKKIAELSQELDAKTVEKEASDAAFKRKVAGLGLLRMASKSVATRVTAEKNALKAELHECRSVLDTKTAEMDALKAELSLQTTANMQSQSESETNVPDIGDFARSAVDIFEDSPSLSSRAAINLGGQSMVANTVEGNSKKSQTEELTKTNSISEPTPRAQDMGPKPKDGVVKKGRGFLSKDANNAKRLFKFGPY